MTLRCALLNCQGLITKRTNKLKTAEFHSIFQSNDIVLCTECWTDELSEIAVNSFENFVLNRYEKKRGSKRNSGGIILYVRSEYVTKDMLIYTSKDDILWVKICKTVLGLDTDLYICLCYVIPDESSRQALNESNIFDRLLDSVIFIENKVDTDYNLLICGDFNARSSDKPDFVTDDDPVHIYVLPDDYTADRFMHRQSEDVGHVNNNGLLLLDFCKQTGLRIMNGRVGQDREIGRYTFVGHRGSSLVDYVLGSQEMFNFVKSFEVQEPNILSDHCVVNFSFEFGSCMMQENESDNYDHISEKYTWKNDLKDEYVNRLNYESTKRQLNLLNSNISECSNESDIHSCVSEFVNIIHNVSAPLFKKSIKTEKCNNSFSNEKQNPWFNDECQEKRIVFYIC